MVVAHLVEWLLPQPEVHGSKPAISKIYIEYLLTVSCEFVEKMKIKEKEVGNGPFLNNNLSITES